MTSTSRFVVRVFRGIAILASFAIVTGCAEVLTTGSAPPPVGPPNAASQSPNMDFAKIGSLGVFPLFVAPRGVEDEQFSEQMIGALTNEVQTRQSQWKIFGYREVLGFINQGNLGQGYKNLQADYNTFSPGGMFVFSPPTREFLRQMQSTANVDAFLFGSYTIQQKEVVEQTILGPARKAVWECHLTLSLWHAKDQQTWWTAEHGLAGSRDQVVAQMARTMAAYVGKGTLRQL